MTLLHRIGFLLVVTCLSWVVSPTVLIAEEPWQPSMPYQGHLGEPNSYQVDFSAVVTAPYQTKLLKVWLPIPQSDVAQKISRSQLTTFPEQVKPQIAAEPVYGNKFAYFEFHHPRGAQIIRHRFTATVHDLHWQMDAKKVATVDHWPKTFEPYLQPQSIATTEKFRNVLGEISPRREPSAANFFSAIEWVDQNLTYDHVNASLQADAGHAFTQRHGHCSDYHGLCATMGRALGLPTRMTYGLALYPKNSPSHCKIEAFIAPYGWVSFDVSETQKMVAAIHRSDALTVAEKARLAAAARARLLAGFRENSWLLVTKGANYDLAPPAAQAVNVVRTIYAEADGRALPEPDPANHQQREFSWMTAHKYQASQPVVKPFKNFDTLVD